MQTPTDFDQQLQQALEARRTLLQEQRIPELKQEFHLFHSSFRAMIQVLEKKGILQPDPYKSDERISEVTPPPDNAFLESEKDQQMSIRLSRFDNQLDYLNSYFQFDLDFMTLARMKNLVGLVKYIRWHQLTETSTHLMTRTLAEYIGRLVRDHDQLSAGITKDAQDQLARRSRTVLQLLKAVADYQREAIKYAMSTELLPHCRVDPAKIGVEREAVLKQLRRGAALAQPPVPFYADLAGEMLDERFSDQAPQLQKELLDRLKIEEKKPQVQSRREEFRAILQDAVRTMVTGGGTLTSLVEKSRENAALLHARRKSVIDRFKDWVDRVTNRPTDKLLFSVEFLDENTSARHSEEIDLEQFTDGVQKRARLYGAILNRVSAPARKIQEAGEEQLFQFLQKEIEELFILHRRFSAIDTYIRSEVAREHRAELRGINTELAALKEHILRVNKKRHSYVARKEEQEQLKKLGIAEVE
ncbi:MAG: hypothetical protein EA403_07280 [Spirochaetaceae bacterium]|nr:MAG: hypothetical protein EA403_07280 [Spirochaetaceae bacterium]